METPQPVQWPTKAPWIHRAWIGPVLGALAFLLTFGFVGAVTGEIMLKVSEADRLVASVEASEAAMIGYQESIKVIVEEFGDTAGLTDEDRALMLEEIGAAAQEAVPVVDRAGAAVAGVGFLPWHGDLAKARDAYLAHNRAWSEYLAVVAEDPAQVDATSDEIDSTFMEAERLLRGSVPDTSLRDLDARLDVIFAVPLDQSQGQLA